MSDDDRTDSGAMETLQTRVRALESECEELRERLAFLELIFQADQLAAYEDDVRSGEVVFDAHLGELLGPGSCDAVLGTASWHARCHPDDRPRIERSRQDYLTGRSPRFDEDYRVRHESGAWVWVRDRARVVTFDEQGRPLRLRGALRDITARKGVEQALRESEERYRRITEAVTDYIYTVRIQDGAAAETRHGPGCVAVTGYDPAEFAAQPLLWHRMVLDEDRPAVEAHTARLARGEDAGPLEHRLLRKDGAVRWVRNTPVLHRDAESLLLSYDGLIQDITERKEAEESLAAERERLEVTLRSIGDGVIATDTEGRVRIVNRAAEQLTGWPQQEALSRPLDEVFRIVHERSGQRCDSPVGRVLRTGQTVALGNHTLLIARDGGERVIADSAAPIHDTRGEIVGVVLAFRDVTEKERLGEELLKTQKLESIGLLAGGIAHDFNNVLVGILGNLSLAKELASPGDKVRERLIEAEKAADQARALTRQLLTFARGGAPIRTVACVGPLVQEATTLALRGSNVDAVFDLAEDLWLAEIDQGQIHQAITNLVLNAAQAMPAGGHVRVSAANEELRTGNPFALAPGRYAVVRVSDDGIGIPQNLLGRIFDPYFTTKQRGSGLGLATTYSILKGHEGHVAVESRLGSGSTFTAYLPATARALPGADPPSKDARHWRGKVLVMDDDPGVLRLAAEVLRVKGCEVACARDGAEALDLFRRASDAGRPFDAVIVDLTVPGGMGGRETIARLRAVAPGVKAIVSSGYSNDPIMASYRDHGFEAVLLKPYTATALIEALQRACSADAEP